MHEVDGREDDSKSDSDDESRATRLVSTDKGNNGCPRLESDLAG